MRAKHIKTVISVLFLTGLLSCGHAAPKPSDIDLRGRVKKVVLDNGMTFLFARRDTTPTFSVQLKVKVGGIEEDAGATGLAHFFEHMAFKGTDKIGTKDFVAEKPILDQIHVVGTEIALMKKAGKPPEAYADLIAKRKELEAQENQFIEKNDFMRIFQRNGGSDINASTSTDYTTYYVSLPSNKFELWAYLQSEQFSNRVFREFFTEKDVVAEERRMRIDNTPDGRLYEAFMNEAFDKSPYKVLSIGHARDIQAYTPQDAKAFYDRYYIPSRMIVAIVGDIDIDFAEKIVTKYFSKLPKKEAQDKMIPSETFDNSYPRSVTLKDPAASQFYLGYHRPAFPHPDDLVMDVVQDLLCSGHTSRLYKRLVLKERSVSSVSCYSNVPGVRLDSLFTFNGEPLPGHTNREVQNVIREEIAKLVKEGPSEKELEIIKNQNDADLIYSLESNEGLASTLAFYEAWAGDWQFLYTALDRVHSITAADVQRVVKTYFVPSREVSANLEHVEKP